MKYYVHKQLKKVLAMSTLLLWMGNLSSYAQDFSKFKLNVAGVSVTADNAGYITAPEGSGCEISGVSFDPVTCTLTLDNAVIKAHNRGTDVGGYYGSEGINYYKYIGAKDLTIKLIGKSFIETDYTGIDAEGNLTIVNGNVGTAAQAALQVVVSDLNSFMFNGIELYDEGLISNLAIEGCVVDVLAHGAAIAGYDNFSDGVSHVTMNLNVGDGALRARTTGAQGAFKHVNYTDGDIRLPKGVSQVPNDAKEVRISPYISFMDNTVQNICVDNWDDNGDGQLDYIEASLVTSLGEKFTSNSQIKTFEELIYFIGIEYVDDNAFSECSQLKWYEVPPYAKEIGSWAFPRTAPIIITIPRSVTKINNFAFYDCGSLSDVVFEEDSKLVEVGANAFQACPIQNMNLPASLKIIGEEAFFSNKMRSLTIPASVNYIGDYAFIQITEVPAIYQSIIVKGITPATIGKDVFGPTEGNVTGLLDPDVTHIYVPSTYSNTLSNYMAAWPQYADYMCTEASYGIYVAGVELTENNVGPDKPFSYVNGNTIVQGVYYDPQTLTLKLADAKIKTMSTRKPAIDITNGATIKLSGKSHIQSNAGGIRAMGWVTIEPVDPSDDPTSYQLTIDAVDYGIEFDNSIFGNWNSLSIENVRVDMNISDGPCIDGGPYENTDPDDEFYIQVGDPASLSFDNVLIKATSPERYVMQNAWGYSLDNCSVIYPNGYSTPAGVKDELRIGKCIDFYDDNAEAVCVDKWDTNGDGGLDVWEAEAVETLGTAFTGNTDITDFPELRYFTGLDEICDRAFNGCSSLCWVDFPESIKRIGVSAFQGCSLYPQLDEGLVEVDDYAFKGCPMENIGIPSTLKKIGKEAFYGALGFYFMGSFYGTDAEAEPQLESIGERAFYESSSFDYLPASLKEIGDEAFGGSSSKYIYLTVKGTVPASVGNSIFGELEDGSEIYVPEGKASVYKRKWSEYKDYIVGEELPIETGIKQMAADRTKPQGVYSLDGRLVRQNTSTEGLPKGIYMVNGKKVMVK